VLPFLVLGIKAVFVLAWAGWLLRGLLQP
jgi:hypothetical protein